MTVPLRSVPDLPPLPSSIVSGEGVPTVEEFGVLVAEHADTGVTAWEIRDRNVAEWAARRLTEARTALDERRAEAQAWHEQIDEWFSSVTGEVQSIESFMVSCLRAYALRYRKETKKATLKLPSMDVRTTHRDGYVVVDDEAAFVEWAKVSDPEALRVKYEPIAAVVKGYRDVIVTSAMGDEIISESIVIVDADGEVVPGLGWHDETTTCNP
jgi:hypothetical protein